MPQHRKPIQANLVEFSCDCGQGVYRLVQNPPVSSSFNHLWLHKCSHCNREAELTAPYPMVEIASGNFERAFVLKDALPLPESPGLQFEGDRPSVVEKG